MDSTFFLFILALIITIVLDRWLMARMVKKWLARHVGDQKPVVLLFGVPSPFLTDLLRFRRIKSLASSNRKWVKLAVPIVDSAGKVAYKFDSGEEQTAEIASGPETVAIDDVNNPPVDTRDAQEENKKSRALRIKEIPFLHSGWEWKPPTRPFWMALLEIILIAIWALWVGRFQLNMDIEQIPIGHEYPLQIQSNYVWQMLPRCGLCMLWNGTINGGAPSFVELQGAVLHPAVILTTLFFGTVNGGKVILLISLFMAGLATWWIARVMDLGFIARMWASAMAVVGGNLAGKMENGNIIVLFSTASACLVLAPLLELVLKRRRRAIIWLGISLALAWLSGQGYLQIAILVGILPPYALILLTADRKRAPVFKDFFLGLGLSILLAGVLLVPVLHFSPYLVKDTDSNLNLLQSIQYAPLNLLIFDADVFRSEILGLTGASYVFLNFIGWVPILFAIVTLRFVTREKIRLLIFFLTTVCWLYIISTANFVQPLLKVAPWISNVRNPPLFQGLAVPLILAMAAWGFDLLLKKAWPRIGLLLSSGRSMSISAAWVVIGIPTLIGLYQGYQFSQLYLKPMNWKVSAELVQELKTPSTEWVGVPLGENFWTMRMFDQDMKIACIFRPWYFKDHPCPPPYLEATRFPEDQNKPGFETVVDAMNIIRYPNQEYASILTRNGRVPCNATALDGNIDVVCNSESGGTLLVNENYFSGWSAWVDGQPQPLLEGDWLILQAMPGSHTYQFRYRPWDVWVGLAVTLAGVALAVWIGFFYRKQNF